MDSPTTRVLGLLELLQAHAELGGGELARRLGVDGRTLRRYIARLKGLGIPVESDRGRHGAYHLRPGSRLPPLMFTHPEAMAASVGLMFASQVGLDDARAGARSAQAKLERVMPQGLADRLRALERTLHFDLAASSIVVSTTALLALGSRAHARHRVAIHYVAADDLFDAIGLLTPDGDQVLLHGQADDLDWYARQLARLPFDFDIIAPAPLRDALQALGARLQGLARPARTASARQSGRQRTRASW